jgi:hypothetical protein
VALIFFSLFMIFGPPLLVYLHAPEEIRKHVQRSSSEPSWAGLILLLFFMVLGVGFLAKPLAAVNRFSPRDLTAERDARRGTYVLRIFGGFLVLVSLLGIWFQLSRHFRH